MAAATSTTRNFLASMPVVSVSSSSRFIFVSSSCSSVLRRYVNGLAPAGAHDEVHLVPWAQRYALSHDLPQTTDLHLASEAAAQLVVDRDTDWQTVVVAVHHGLLHLLGAQALDEPVERLVRPVHLARDRVAREATQMAQEQADAAGALHLALTGLHQLLEPGNARVELVQDGLSLRTGDVYLATVADHGHAVAQQRHHRKTQLLATQLGPTHAVGQAQTRVLGLLPWQTGHGGCHVVEVGGGILQVATHHLGRSEEGRGGKEGR